MKLKKKWPSERLPWIETYFYFEIADVEKIFEVEDFCPFPHPYASLLMGRSKVENKFRLPWHVKQLSSYQKKSHVHFQNHTF